MAQLNSRGTQTRGRWDFFEHSNGVASIYGQVVSGSIGAYFANNSTGAAAIDIYTLNWAASVAGVFSIALFLPPLVMAPLTPLETHLFPLQPDLAAPPGVMGMFTTSTGAYETMFRYSGGSSGAQVAPIMGSYFVTLPPDWAIGVSGLGSANPCELSLTIWYQYVTDNISPAR